MLELSQESVMGETVVLEIPEEAARSAREIARRTKRPLEEVLLDWIDKGAAELPVGLLSDEEILALCQSQLESGEQEELSHLLALNREGELSTGESQQLDEAMLVYRRGLLRKAQAWQEASARGLKTSFS
jgi:hypothetical protein